jgi:hypothetical protein
MSGARHRGVVHRRHLRALVVPPSTMPTELRMPHPIRTPLAAHRSSSTRRWVAAWAVAVLGAASLAPAAAAQGPAPRILTPIAEGARVRVSRSGAPALVGAFLAVRADSVLMRTAAGDTTAVPLGSVRALELSRGLQSQEGDGAIVGLLVGAVGGMTIAAATYEEPEPQRCRSETISGCVVEGVAGALVDGLRPGRKARAVGGGLLGGIAGALIGRVVGSNLRAEGWRGVPISRAADRRVGLGVPPRHHGQGVGVVVAF